MLERLIHHPRFVPSLIVAVSLGALGTAWASEVWGGLQPCILCYYQRYTYMVAAAFGMAGIAFGNWPLARAAFVALAGAAFLGGAGIAMFHVGVEQHWWRGTAECHAPVFDPTASTAQLREQLLARPFAPCDRVPWSLFGISMAGYNAIVSLGLGLASLWAAWAMAKRRAR